MKFPPALAAPLHAIPLPLIEQATRLMFFRLLKQHPGLFDRLDRHKAKRYAFLPDDLPLGFLVEPARSAITVFRKPERPETDATVEGPLFLLLVLLEGRCDADALFFSRDLSVSGDMEAMLALRNALDDCDLDLPRDLAALAGPLSPLFARAANAIRSRALAGEAAPWN